jgi:hypothetical protein
VSVLVTGAAGGGPGPAGRRMAGLLLDRGVRCVPSYRRETTVLSTFGSPAPRWQFAPVPDRLGGHDVPDGLGLAGTASGKAVRPLADFVQIEPLMAVAFFRCRVREVTDHGRSLARILANGWMIMATHPAVHGPQSATPMALDPVHHGDGQDGADLALLGDPDTASRGAGWRKWLRWGRTKVVLKRGQPR